MPTAPIIDQRADAAIEKELLRDPQVQDALATLDDPEEREDLLDALVVTTRLKEGKEKTYALEDVIRNAGI